MRFKRSDVPEFRNKDLVANIDCIKFWSHSLGNPEPDNPDRPVVRKILGPTVAQYVLLKLSLQNIIIIIIIIIIITLFGTVQGG